MSEHACSDEYEMPSNAPLVSKNARALEHSDGIAEKIPAMALGVSTHAIAEDGAERAQSVLQTCA